MPPNAIAWLVICSCVIRAAAGWAATTTAAAHTPYKLARRRKRVAPRRTLSQFIAVMRSILFPPHSGWSDTLLFRELVAWVWTVMHPIVVPTGYVAGSWLA